MRLIVDSGEYEAPTLLGLLWLVFTHRVFHLITDGRFVD